MAKKTTAEQALSRIFNIARGMVSTEFSDKETKSRMNNVKRGNVTALVSSCIDEENYGVTKLLVKSGADLNIVTDQGSSALVEAVTRENIELIKMLLRKGAYIHHKE